MSGPDIDQSDPGLCACMCWKPVKGQWSQLYPSQMAERVEIEEEKKTQLLENVCV